MKERAILNQQHDRAYQALKIKTDEKDNKKKIGNQDAARQWMCQNFFDIRMFGAVMTTGTNCGQVRGPVQLAFSRSIDRIVDLGQSITRMAVTTQAESDKQDGGNRTMGRKDIVPYALYRVHGFVNPFLAAQTGFSDDDLELLWTALGQMFETDRSASRGEMASRKLFVFKHASQLGNAPAHRLFDLIEVSRKKLDEPPRKFSDYEVVVSDADLPPEVQLTQRL